MIRERNVAKKSQSSQNFYPKILMIQKKTLLFYNNIFTCCINNIKDQFSVELND